MILGWRATAAASTAAHIRGIYQVKLPAQRDDNMAVAFAGTQIHAEHREPPCFSSKAGSRPGGQFTFQDEQYAEHPAVSCPGGREFTAVPLRSAIRPRLPSTTGCGNPRARVTGACALAA